MNNINQTNKLIIEEHVTSSGYKVGVVNLNNPDRLNVTDLEMVRAIYQQLMQWQANSTVVAILIQGVGEKAFCAGGDVRRVVELINVGDLVQAAAYFEHEYKLDYLIHTYTKPIICWGHGVVMGGGLGLMMGASHRIVTPTSQVAMPEIMIGFFPDVGISYFLNKLPQGVGLYLALTASVLNATDALSIKWADYFIDDRFKGDMLNGLLKLAWQDNKNSNDVTINDFLRSLQLQSVGKPHAQLTGSMKLIQSLAKLSDLKNVYAFLSKLSVADPWIMKGVENLKLGSPLSAHIIFEQLIKSKDMVLQDVFTLDLTMANHFLQTPDFKEGVRSRLADKDKLPRWQHSSVDAVSSDDIEAFFN